MFGLLITTIAYRRRERWAWFALWYYPAFWTAHLLGGLPPGKEQTMSAPSIYGPLLFVQLDNKPAGIDTAFEEGELEELLLWED